MLPCIRTRAMFSSESLSHLLTIRFTNFVCFFAMLCPLPFFFPTHTASFGPAHPVLHPDDHTYLCSILIYEQRSHLDPPRANNVCYRSFSFEPESRASIDQGWTHAISIQLELFLRPVILLLVAQPGPQQLSNVRERWSVP